MLTSCAAPCAWQMDAWKARQIRVMEVGGNKRLSRMFKKLGIEKQPITAKYAHPGLEDYRERCVVLTAAFAVTPLLIPPPNLHTSVQTWFVLQRWCVRTRRRCAWLPSTLPVGVSCRHQHLE